MADGLGHQVRAEVDDSGHFHPVIRTRDLDGWSVSRDALRPPDVD
jgi:hypothetical protein